MILDKLWCSFVSSVLGFRSDVDEGSVLQGCNVTSLRV
jgi:hypothetical protein